MGEFTGALGLFGGETGADRRGWRTIGETNISHMRVTLSSEAPGSQKLPLAGDSITFWRAIRPIRAGASHPLKQFAFGAFDAQRICAHNRAA